MFHNFHTDCYHTATGSGSNLNMAQKERVNRDRSQYPQCYQYLGAYPVNKCADCSPHNVTSSWAVPRRVVTTKSKLEKVPVVVTLRYRSTAPLTVTRSAVGAEA